MSIWQQYEALADYISLKYQSELHIVLGTATSLIEEELETRSLRSRGASSRASHRFYTQLGRTLTASRTAPAASSYDRTAHLIRFEPEILHRTPKIKSCTTALWIVRGPPRDSLFAQKAELRRWQRKLLQQDLTRPELVFSLV